MARVESLPAGADVGTPPYAVGPQLLHEVR